MEGLSALEELIPSFARPEIVKQQARIEELVEKLLSQNATEPLRRLAVSVLKRLYTSGNSSALPNFVSKLLKITGEQSKKVTNDTRVATLDVIGELMLRDGKSIEGFSTDIFVVVAKHMKLPEANARCSALQCLSKTIAVAGLKSPSVAGNIWKMLQKMLLDKAVMVRTAAAHSLSALAVASPVCASANGAEMAVCCLKALASEDQPNQAFSLSSECRFAFATALSKVLAAMATPVPMAPADRPKKKPAVTDFSSALDFLEQAAAKGPTSGPAYVSCRAAVCLAAVKLAEALEIEDSGSLVVVVRMLLRILDTPPQTKAKTPGVDEELLTQVARYITLSLRHLLLLAETEAVLLELIEQGLVPLISAQFQEASTRKEHTDMRMLVVLEALSGACVAAGEGFQSVVTKVKQPLLHLVGNHPNPVVQLHATYCMRVVARSSPGQLSQLMSLLLNHVTVLSAEMLGAPTKRSAGSSVQPADLQPLCRGLFGHCAALASLAGELFHSALGVPHDVTSAVLGTSRALLQPHPNPTISAQRRSCAFLLLEGLMCLGTDWVGQRLTTLFALWKTVLGKKPVDRAKVLYQQHVAASGAKEPPQGDAAVGAEGSAAACRDELLSLLCALRSLYAFTWHSHDTLLTSLPHLHKILVVFLTNISQLVVALPHPTSPSLKAKHRNDGTKPVVTLSAHCGIPEILLMIRSTMYRTFAAMLPAQYSSRFVPLLNMLADDVTRAPPGDFPLSEFLGHYLHPDDALLDLVDPYTEVSKDAPTTIRLVTDRVLKSLTPGRELPRDLVSDAAAPSYFSPPSREGPGGTESQLTPWDAWFDPRRPMVEQCVSAEWEWRCSAISLLSIIMNSGDVSEQARSAVLAHLLKRRDASEDAPAPHGKKAAPQPPQSDIGCIPTIAVMSYLKEHIKMRGVKVCPPAAPMDQVLQLSLDGLKEANPAVRRLHVEVLSTLFYVHHQLHESPMVHSILQHISTDTASESTPVRSAIALLCGAVLRTFAWAGQLTPGPTQPCPYLLNIAPSLIKLAKETSQPVRLWMLHSIHLSMQAAGPAFAPFLKDSLRLATAHLLADFFESPLVLWVVAELVRSAAFACAASKEAVAADLRNESVSRILGIWNELRHVRYVGSGTGTAFAIVRTEVLCVSTASAIVKLAPLAPHQLRSFFELVSTKLLHPEEGGSLSCAVRGAAAQCMRDLAVPGLGFGQDVSIMQEPGQLFMLLEGAPDEEVQALQDLIHALVGQRGLLQLPMWLQILKEIVLALPPKAVSSGAPPNAHPATPTKRAELPDGSEVQDAHDDGASMADAGAELAPNSAGYRPPRSAAKIFAVSCVHMLLEKPDPDDTWHFQLEMPGSPAVKGRGATAAGAPAHRLVHYLDTIVTMASHASSSDEASLATAGLNLMLLIIRRFRHTRDAQAGEDAEGVPLLLVQFEAQISASIRHNMRAETNPATLRVALELVRDVVIARACTSPQRLIALLMQPFSGSTFEPDPLFCESASTQTFVFRLRCACEILDTEMEEPCMAPHLKELARWTEHALRDGAVLLAGLPLQSVKTYQPTCFSLSDYKAVQPCFREALATFLRGTCALCSAAAVPAAVEGHSARRGAPAGGAAGAAAAGAGDRTPPDLMGLALGLVVLALGDQSAQPTLPDMRVHLRTIRQVLLHTATPGSGDAASTISVRYFLDLFARVWTYVFRVPGRCMPMLPELLELFHAVSGVIWREAPRSGIPTPGDHAERPWAEGLRGDSEDSRLARDTMSAYSLHVVAAALRSEALGAEAGGVSQALEILVWWLSDALPRSLPDGGGDARGGAGAEAEEDDDIVAAALEGDPTSDASSGAASKRSCPWLWLLFGSPFPQALIKVQPAVTLKSWRTVCTILSSSTQSAGIVSHQLPYLALIVNKLTKGLIELLEDHARTLSEVDERDVVYAFALQVPALSAICELLLKATVLHKTSQVRLSGNVKATVNTCLADIKQVFLMGLQHNNAKVVQTTISSMQNLLQGRASAVLCPIMMPCMVVGLVRQPSTLSAAAVESAWGVMSAILVGQQAQGLVEASTRMAVRLIASIAEFSAWSPVAFAAHSAPMAQLLLQVARVDQPGLKAAIAGLSASGQQTVQNLLREQMSASASAQSGPAAPTGPAAPKAKIELKLKF